MIKDIGERLTKLFSDFLFKLNTEVTFNKLRHDALELMKLYEHNKYIIKSDIIIIYDYDYTIAIIKGIVLAGMIEQGKTYKIFGEQLKYIGTLTFNGVKRLNDNVTFNYTFKPKNGLTEEEWDILKGGADNMSMEKYAVDMAELPVTDDQIRELRKLTKEAGVDYKMPRNRKEADDLIEKLAGEQ